MTTKEQSGFRVTRDFFCSLKLTMFLLITLAVISIIGTIIPQGSPPPEYLHSINQNKLKLYQSLGLFRHVSFLVVHTPALAVVCKSLACSVKRLPGIWRTITRPELIMSDDFEKTLSHSTSLQTKGDAAAIKDLVAAAMTAEFAVPVITEESSGAFHLFAQKTPWARLAVYAVHLSVLIIFLGAIIGALFGYKGFVNISEGQSINTVMSRAQKAIGLDFAVLCEKFSVAYYPDGTPREYKSILTILENGQPVPGYNRVPVIVNDPLIYKGITFYQSSYGTLGEHEFTISEPDGSNPQSLMIRSGGSAVLPDGSGIHLLETTEDISQYQAGVSGPAAQVEVRMANGDSRHFISYANNPAMNRMNLSATGGKLVQYKGGEELVYTGLQVAKDPGVWVVWFGCTLMVAGIYAAFFVSHRRIWARVENGRVTIGGHASKNQGGFQLFMDQLLMKLNKQLTAEGRK